MEVSTSVVGTSTASAAAATPLQSTRACVENRKKLADAICFVAQFAMRAHAISCVLIPIASRFLIALVEANQGKVCFGAQASVVSGTIKHALNQRSGSKGVKLLDDTDMAVLITAAHPRM